MDTLNKVREAMKKQVVFSIHAHRQMDMRGITVGEVFEALEAAELVEDYPDDPRGHSCLLLGRTKSGRSLHIICAPSDEGLIVITVYEPSLIEWEPDFKTRRRCP